MIMRCDVSQIDQLPPAYLRATNLRADLGRAVGLYGLGDRSEVVLRTLAHAKAAYDAIGAQVPTPAGVSPSDWRRILTRLAHRYGERPYVDDAAAVHAALAG